MLGVAAAHKELPQKRLEDARCTLLLDIKIKLCDFLVIDLLFTSITANNHDLTNALPRPSKDY